ncbi:MAG: DUF3737 family protein [Bifidobacterium crudilactis]|uniref:DUF3737 family protein n=1 Tax=Bifidobacterium crudilactis TaxID=327277 RepID=A0A971CZ25_9BIFI|nr:DUF3737 family protein [Bifidobacterium crudilactis]MDN6683934.1 DUF3737 family protein [Bifidobacterium crudilactis]NLT79337.1 DUF3737 family protein [Bifidobacterium crudilactis]
MSECVPKGHRSQCHRKQVAQQVLVGERALFHEEGLEISHSIFQAGESPLKESHDVNVRDTSFEWKYPLWYTKQAEVCGGDLLDTARSGIWYTHGITMTDTLIAAPKTFRRSSDITLNHVAMPNAQESLWTCERVALRDVQVNGDYFGMNSGNVKAERLRLNGNYAFDGGHDIEVRDSTLLSKDAFWNCENVTVRDSTIIGEYLGWNSKNLTFINCAIESLQGLCYIDNLVMRGCRLVNTTLAFEYSTVDAEIEGSIDSVMNPASGRIQCESIDELIMEPNRIDPSRTTIITQQH